MGLGDTQPDPPGRLRVDVLRDDGESWFAYTAR
jgi:hypothetical protein